MPVRTATSKKPAGRKRRATGWAFLTLTAALAAAWVWSGLSGYLVAYQAGSTQTSLQVIFANGSLVLLETSPPMPGVSQGFAAVKAPSLRGFWNWFVRFDETRTSPFRTERYWACPLLYLLPIPLIAGVLPLQSGVRARRRVLAGQCLTCGYSRAGLNADTTCPECGKDPVPA